MKHIMFVCKENSRRPQMTEGFARTIGGKTISVPSSGLEASLVDPITVEVRQEIGIDISQQGSPALADFKAKDFDAVISLCGCGVNWPPAWSTRELFADCQLDDPEGRSREEVKPQVEKLLQTLGAITA
ncbi:MAG: ArsC family transcriptional regulator [Cyanobacteria bacterium J06641_5]